MIYLINPSEKRILENAGDRIPIGLLSIAGKLEEDGHNVKVFDLNHDTHMQLTEEFEKDKPEAMGISVYTSSIYLEAVRLAGQFKNKTRLIAGGYHATALPKSLIEHFDAVVPGEAENSFSEALKVNGIIKRDTPHLSSLPNPAYHLVDLSRYGITQSGKRTATLITSRGCPYDCSFCGKYSRMVRFEPTSKIKQQIDQLKKAGFESFYFVDDVFTLHQDRMEEILEYVKSPSRITTRANLMDESKLEIMADNKVRWMSLGIESGDNNILEKSNKGMTTHQNFQAVHISNIFGINTKGFFIIGLPGESEGTAKKTIDFSLHLRKFGLRKADFYFLTPFPGTPIWDDPKKFDIEITDRDYTKYLEAGKGAKCYVNTKFLKAERIEELVHEARARWT